MLDLACRETSDCPPSEQAEGAAPAVVADPWPQFFAEVLQLGRRYGARLNERLKTEGFSRASWPILYWLDQHPDGMTQKQLAGLIGIETPNLTRQLDAAEKAGLVERRPHARDRRSNIVVLTPASRPVLERMAKIASEVRQQALAGIEAERLWSTMQTLRRVRRKLESPAPNKGLPG